MIESKVSRALSAGSSYLLTSSDKRIFNGGNGVVGEVFPDCTSTYCKWSKYHRDKPNPADDWDSSGDQYLELRNERYYQSEPLNRRATDAQAAHHADPRALLTRSRRRNKAQFGTTRQLEVTSILLTTSRSLG